MEKEEFSSYNAMTDYMAFREESSYDSPQGKRWAALPPHATICDTMEHAEREARSAIDWLISHK